MMFNSILIKKLYIIRLRLIFGFAREKWGIEVDRKIGILYTPYKKPPALLRVPEVIFLNLYGFILSELVWI